MASFLQVDITTDSRENADMIARDLVERRLAACVQVEGPITSTYWWENSVEESVEWRCRAKTRTDLFDRVTAAVRHLHPYVTPEILGTPIQACAPDYREWLEEEMEPGVSL